MRGLILIFVLMSSAAFGQSMNLRNQLAVLVCKGKYKDSSNRFEMSYVSGFESMRVNNFAANNDQTSSEWSIETVYRTATGFAVGGYFANNDGYYISIDGSTGTARFYRLAGPFDVRFIFDIIDQVAQPSQCSIEL